MDEIDAIGGRRFSEGTSADREIQRTLMELLNQMDGFDRLGQVKMIMATNRPDVLDPALLRPGRLDRKIGEWESGWTFIQNFFIFFPSTLPSPSPLSLSFLHLSLPPPPPFPYSTIPPLPLSTTFPPQRFHCPMSRLD